LPGLRRQLATRYAPGDDLIATMEWARTNLPHAVSAYDARFLPPPAAVPELDQAEAMLSPWALGHFVTFYAELPAPADGFGYGFMDSIRFFLSESEEEALAIARDRRSRWIAATDLTPKMNDYAKPSVARPTSPSGTRGRRPPISGREATVRFRRAGPRPGGSIVHASQPAFQDRIVARWKIDPLTRVTRLRRSVRRAVLVE
jgi:hypothetical protein